VFRSGLLRFELPSFCVKYRVGGGWRIGSERMRTFALKKTPQGLSKRPSRMPQLTNMLPPSLDCFEAASDKTKLMEINGASGARFRWRCLPPRRPRGRIDA
jgi:hypothetical protein